METPIEGSRHESISIMQCHKGFERCDFFLTSPEDGRDVNLGEGFQMMGKIRSGVFNVVFFHCSTQHFREIFQFDL